MSGSNSCTPVCDCNFAMKNTGQQSCIPLMSVAKMLIFLNKYADDGTRNSINLATTLNAAFFAALINQADRSKRWYPLPQMLDVDDNRADAIVETMSDDSTIFIADGIRTFTAKFFGKKANSILKGQIASARCGDMGVFIVDLNGSILGGSVSSDNTKLYPFSIDSQSIDLKEINPKDKNSQALQMKFNFTRDVDFACARMVTVPDMADDVDLLSLEGLKDVKALISAITINGFTAKIYVESINPKNPVTIKGLVTADFISKVGAAPSKIYRGNNTPGDEAITVTEKAEPDEGTYDIVLTTPADPDDELYLKILKAKYDSVDLAKKVITIP